MITSADAMSIGERAPGAMVRSYKSGAVAYLRKPVQVDQLLRAVGDLNGYRLLIARGGE